MKLGLLSLCAAALFGCATLEAEFPKTTAAANTIVADLEKTPPASDTQIEQDVARDLAGQPGVDVIVAIQTIAKALLLVGDVPAAVVSTLTTLVSTEQAKTSAGVHFRVGVDSGPRASLDALPYTRVLSGNYPTPPPLNDLADLVGHIDCSGVMYTTNPPTFASDPCGVARLGPPVAF